MNPEQRPITASYDQPTENVTTATDPPLAGPDAQASAAAYPPTRIVYQLDTEHRVYRGEAICHTDAEVQAAIARLNTAGLPVAVFRLDSIHLPAPTPS